MISNGFFAISACAVCLLWLRILSPTTFSDMEWMDQTTGNGLGAFVLFGSFVAWPLASSIFVTRGRQPIIMIAISATTLGFFYAGLFLTYEFWALVGTGEYTRMIGDTVLSAPSFATNASFLIFISITPIIIAKLLDLVFTKRR